MQYDVSRDQRQRKPFNQLILASAAVTLLMGCSMKRAAVNLAGDAISGEGRAYSSDDEPEFIREAVPFGIKVSEALLGESPTHRGPLLTVAKGYAVYADLLQDEGFGLSGAGGAGGDP